MGIKNERFYSPKDIVIITMIFIFITIPFLKDYGWWVWVPALLSLWSILWAFHMFSIEIWPYIRFSVFSIWYSEDTLSKTDFTGSRNITIHSIDVQGDEVLIKYEKDGKVGIFQMKAKIAKDFDILCIENLVKLLVHFKP